MSEPEASSPDDSAPSLETSADQIKPTPPAASDAVAPLETAVPQQDDPLPTQESSPKVALASEAGVADQPVPTTIATFRTHRFNPLSNSHPALVIGQCTVQMIKHHRRIDSDENQAIFNILRSIAHIAPLLTLQDDKDLHIRTSLRNILGETNKKVGLSGRYEYPEPLRKKAAILLDGLDARFAVEVARDDTPDQQEQAESPPKKRRKISKPAAIKSRAPLPTLDHPSMKQMLRGIVLRDNPRVYALDRTAADGPRDCRGFGHNGLAVGQWWPLRICALRDGAHGSSQGGIAGNSEVGAWSIVVSGTFPAQMGRPSDISCALCTKGLRSLRALSFISRRKNLEAFKYL